MFSSRWLAALTGRRGAAIAASLCAVWYAGLISGFTFRLLSPVPRGLMFNDMLVHLLLGRFDISPGVITEEGFLHDGKVYAYFGILPAFLRLPLLLIPDGISIDVTTLYIVLAGAFTTYWNLRAMDAVRQRVMDNPRATSLLFCLAIGTMLGSSVVPFLRPSIYQEAIGWAMAFSALFIFHGIKGATGKFSTGLLREMAVTAGCALMCRVSTGVGLYAALGFLVLRLAWPGRWEPLAWLRRLLADSMRPALAVMLLFLAAALAVNWARWGNPFTVVDLHEALMNGSFPGRLPRLDATGAFNWERLWLGVMYYFFPACLLPLEGNRLFLEDLSHRLVEFELPPDSFLISSPLLVILSGLLFARLRSAWRMFPGLVAMAAGTALPAILMLGLIFMNFRYRQEFHPILNISALGAVSLGLGNYFHRAAWPLALGSAIVAHFMLFLYFHSDWGPASAESVHLMVWRTMRAAGF